MKIEPDEQGRKLFSGTMCVLDDEMGQNGLQYGIKANCRRFSYSFRAFNQSEAEYICQQIGIVYEGEVIEMGPIDDLFFQ